MHVINSLLGYCMVERCDTERRDPFMNITFWMYLS